MKNEDLANHLESIRLRDRRGVLRPRSVVDEAESAEHPLHDLFDWDNDAAADKHRLWQARQLIIRVRVTIYEHQTETVRAYHSLSSERRQPGEDEGLGSAGSYRPLTEIMSNEDLRGMLLSDALRDLRTYQRKYQTLVELVPLFEVAEEILPPEEPGGAGRKKKAKKKAKKAKKKVAKVAKKSTKRRRKASA